MSVKRLYRSKHIKITNQASLKKTLLFILMFWLCIPMSVFAQDSKADILVLPKDWRYEKIDFPLDFAPDIPFKGFEELRFAPGMFDRSSNTYFTYIFVVSIDNKPKLKRKNIKTFLNQYYKGLCEAVAKPKKLSVDTSKMRLKLKRAKKTDRNKRSHLATMPFFDTFNHGEEVILNMELDIISTKQKSYIFALVSPHSKDAPIWKEMRSIKEETFIENH